MIYGVAFLRGGVNRDSHVSVTGRSHYWCFCDSSIRMLLVLVRPPQFADSQQHTPNESKAFKNTHSQWSSAISQAIPKGFERVQHHITSESEALQVTSQISDLENGSYSCGAAAREWFDPLWDTLTSQGRESEIGGREVRTLDLNGSREC